MPNGDKAMRLDEGKILYNDLAERIKNLPSVDNVVAVTDVEPTEEGVKIWLPETPPQAIQVPTYAEFQQLEQDVDAKVSDVQVNGSSVVNNGVANIPVASANSVGVVKTGTGIAVEAGTGRIYIDNASSAQIKAGSTSGIAIPPFRQHESAFYGLAKAAGDSTQASSSNAVGTYTPEAQASIKSMIGVGEEAYFISKNSFTNPTTVNSNASSVINTALTAAKTAGKNYCVIPEGEYWLTETIYLQDGVILKGSGMDVTTLKIADNCDIDAIRVAGPINNSGIMDLAIDGNRITNYSTFSNGHHGNAINVWLHYGRIERVRTNWVYKHSLLLNYDTGNSDDGLEFDLEHQNDMGNLNKVLWCDFRDSLLQGVMWGWRTMDSWMCYTNIGSHAANLYLEGGTSRFIGNHFDGDGDNGAGPEYNVYCGDGCKAMLFDGNIFENTQKQNIFFRQPSYSNQTMTITISNNIIRTCSKSQNEQYPNIYISGYSDSVKATEIAITGNQILNPDTNANHGYAGIHLAYCDNCKIIGNTFFNVGSNEVVIDNTCSNILNDGSMPKDVQVNGTSVVSNGVANVPAADATTYGVVKVSSNLGVVVGTSNCLSIQAATAEYIKTGETSIYPLAPSTVNATVFYGLSKAAGVDLKNETVTLGTYPAASKSAIQTMLGVEQGVTFVETVTGTTPTITGQPNVRYICGEVSLLTITPPSAGTITVIFESGSTPTVLTLPSTVKFPEWVDISTLEANTTYEIIITDGVYGGVMSWAD